MESVDHYAASIINKYRVIHDEDSPSHRAADELMPLLKEWGKQYLLGITLSGAYVKNTAVSLSSHVDILIALSPVPGADMKKIYWNLFEFLSERDQGPSAGNVAIRVKHNGLMVDLIPAYRVGATGNQLFHKKSGAALETDVARHVHIVGSSGRQEEICALKIWRERHNLDFPSLYLELTVLQALEGERFGQLADNLRAVFRHVSSRLEKILLRDPVNSSNVISNDLSASDKRAVAKAATKALEQDNWKKIIW